MTEQYTPSRAEDAIAATSDFLSTELGATIDGEQAAAQVAEHLSSVQDRAKALLQAIPHPTLGKQGLYVPLSKYNATSYDEAVAVLPGHLVLLPSAIIDPGTTELYSAMVSEDGIALRKLRLHVLRQPYHRDASYGAGVMLAAAGQSETKGVGMHGKKSSDGLEAEHFPTLLAAGTDPALQAAWKNGSHINHKWRENDQNSVFRQVTSLLFTENTPPATVTVTRQDIEAGKKMLLWDIDLLDEANKTPANAGKEKALVLYQALAFQAMLGVSAENPQGTSTGNKRLNSIKDLIA